MVFLETRMSISECVQALIDQDFTSDETVLGIARQIAADGDVDRLTPNQQYYYDKYIRRFLTLPCSQVDCEFDADLSNVANAIRYADDLDMVSATCEHCDYIGSKNARDD